MSIKTRHPEHRMPCFSLLYTCKGVCSAGIAMLIKLDSDMPIIPTGAVRIE